MRILDHSIPALRPPTVFAELRQKERLGVIDQDDNGTSLQECKFGPAHFSLELVLSCPLLNTQRHSFLSHIRLLLTDNHESRDIHPTTFARNLPEGSCFSLTVSRLTFDPRYLRMREKISVSAPNAPPIAL